MAWLALLALMLIVAAAPGVSLYLEHLRAAASESNEGMGDEPQHAA